MTIALPSLDAFVAELVLAWQRIVLYNPGHPARSEASGKPYRQLTALLAPAGEISVAVARDALVTADERLQSVPARKLAAALYQAGVGIVRLRDGIEQRELESFLHHLPRREGGRPPRPLWEEMADAGVVHLHLEPIDFSAVRATATLDDEGQETEEEGEPLWDQILRKLLADERFVAGPAAHVSAQRASMAEVLRLMSGVLQRRGIALQPGSGSSGGSDGEGGKGVDPAAALGSLLASVVTGHLAGQRQRAPRRATVHQLAELLGAIPEELRERLLDAALGQLVADDETAPDLEAFAASVSAAQMVSSLRRLREQQVSFSAPARALVQELVTSAGPAVQPVALPGDPNAVAKQLQDLFAAEDVDRVGPAEIDRLILELPGIGAAPPRSAELDDRLDGLIEEKQLATVAGVLLELMQSPALGEAELAGVGQRIEAVFRGLLIAGRVRAAVNVVERLQAISGAQSTSAVVRQATMACLDSLRQRAATVALLDAVRNAVEDARPLLQRLVALLGAPAVVQLLLALGEEEDLARRRQTFALLLGLGAEMVPSATVLLGDERWFVVRNMLSLLRQSGARIPLAKLQPCLEHDDPRVRAEAVRCLALPGMAPPPPVLAKLIADPDERVADAAVAVVGSAKLAAGSEPLLALLRPADPLGRNRALRLKALHALGELGDPRALGELKS
ncbi:MAG TPA: HEAT repeat domain-containing protein, partial [Thermoanaerobaculia bacterium]|nr:HEAT repeat domain-containing protein [Thermoanaerobaculia bacterium]